MNTLADTKNIQLQKLNFEYAFRPAYYFSRFAGLWSFSIIHDSNWSIQRTRIGLSDVLWSISMICLNLTLAFLTYKRLKEGDEKSDTRLVMLHIFRMAFLLIGVLEILLDMINRNKLVDILQKFNGFDNEVSINYTKFSSTNLNEV